MRRRQRMGRVPRRHRLQFEQLERRRQLAATLVIAEINYQPYEPVAEFGETATSANDFEFIEVLNTGTAPVNLAGMSFVQRDIGGNLEGVNYTFGSVSLAAAERIVVVRDIDAFRSRYGALPRVAGTWSGGGLSNNGELLTLVDGTGATVSQVAYDSNSSWPARAAGVGASIEVKVPAADLNDADNWRSSVEYGGSPGRAPGDRTPRFQINEVLAHTDLPDVDTVEFRNLTSQPLDVSRWYFSDRLGNPFNYSFPVGTIVPANGYLLIDQTDFSPGGGSLPNDFLLSERGDNLIVVSAGANSRPLNFEDVIVLSPTANGVTVGNPHDIRDGSELLPLAENTLGRLNGDHGTAKVVVSEIQYHATDDDMYKEFIELHNTTTEVVALGDWRVEQGIELTVPGGTLLNPGEVVVAVAFDPNDVARATAFRTFYGIDSTVRLLGPWSVDNEGQPDTLSNNGDELMIREPMNDIDLVVYAAVDRVEYNDSDPWSPVADGEGGSLVRRSLDAYGNAGASWVGARPSPGNQPINLLLSPPLSAGTAVDDKLGWDGTALAGAGDIDVYQFQPANSGTYIFQADGVGVAANAADTVLRVFNAAGSQLGFNDNQLGSTNSRVELPLTAGANYFVVVSGHSDTPESYNPFTGLGLVVGAVGDYRVKVTEAITTLPPWQNSDDPLDVDGDGGVFPLDALWIINELNVPQYRDPVTGELPSPPDVIPAFFDVDGDGFVSPTDAILVINQLNTPPTPPVAAIAVGAVQPALAAVESRVAADLVAAAIDQAWADDRSQLDADNEEPGGLP